MVKGLKLWDVRVRPNMKSLSDFQKMFEVSSDKKKDLEKFKSKFFPFISSVTHQPEIYQILMLADLVEKAKDYETHGQTDEIAFAKNLSMTFDLINWETDYLPAGTLLSTYMKSQQKSIYPISIRTKLKNNAQKQLVLSGYLIADLKTGENLEAKKHFEKTNLALSEIQFMIKKGWFIPLKEDYVNANTPELSLINFSDIKQLQEILKYRVMLSRVEDNVMRYPQILKSYLELIPQSFLQETLQSSITATSKEMMRNMAQVSSWYEKICKLDAADEYERMKNNLLKENLKMTYLFQKSYFRSLKRHGAVHFELDNKPVDEKQFYQSFSVLENDIKNGKFDFSNMTLQQLVKKFEGQEAKTENQEDETSVEELEEKDTSHMS